MKQNDGHNRVNDLSALQVEEILKNLHSLISPYIQQLEKLAEEIVSELGDLGQCWDSGASLSA